MESSTVGAIPVALLLALGLVFASQFSLEVQPNRTQKALEHLGIDVEENYGHPFAAFGRSDGNEPGQSFRSNLSNQYTIATVLG